MCPSVFTVIPVKSRKPGFYRLELRLYCEQPEEFHATPEPSYVIDEPARWLAKIGPYLGFLLTILKHAVPLAGPVLGLTAEQLAKELDGELKLMTELVKELPETVSMDQFRAEELRHSQLDVDYRALHALLNQLDPSNHWAGLSRTATPEGMVLWLCRDHAQQYSA
jgi:internalin A